eukprot:jgi/Mesvir1/11062/Mv24101-RA.1
MEAVSATIAIGFVETTMVRYVCSARVSDIVRAFSLRDTDVSAVFSFEDVASSSASAFFSFSSVGGFVDLRPMDKGGFPDKTVYKTTPSRNAVTHRVRKLRNFSNAVA